MKTHIHLNTATPDRLATRPAFTLIEIITVIAIIVALAAMTISGLGYYKEKVQKSSTRIFIGTLESALEDYHTDNQEYPTDGADGSGRSTKILYQALYGVSGGINDIPDNGATVYLATLDPRAKQNNRNVERQGVGSAYYLVDSFRNKEGSEKGKGRRMRYYCSPNTAAGGYSNPMNPVTSFDLWSVGPDGTDKNVDRQKDDITNWK